MNQRQILGEILIAFGEYFDKRLTPAQIAMYVEDLSDLSAEEFKTACRLYRQDPRNDRFPLPAKIIALARPQPTADDVGREIAARIIDSVHKDGHANPERARERMGEHGWTIVSRMGGWSSFCAELTNENLPMYRAQIRDLAATMKRAERPEEATISPKITHDPRVLKLIQTVLPPKDGP